ncbi:uncharacterized protein CEXT_45451 [Caerostris extrusa]|uniref:Uncharacterized protein n=1 Tax=Caerostris extrusa TaxID=172846 RepID=A0AAV4SUQ1_CAEEX|nr:uncharacterized protein CEXT_45451 [Caerostris extrusa]
MSDVSAREKCEEHLPECECYELLELNNVGMICQNVSDFEAFGHILSSGSVFKVEEGAFDGVLELRYIYVSRSSMKEIPDFRAAIRSILSDLRLDNSRLIQLRGDNLKNMTQLWTLSLVNNSIAHVADDVFQGTENVVDFDISHNLLTFLPPGLFMSWKRLENLRLSYNQLLHVDQLFWNEPRGQLCFDKCSLECE